MRIHPVRHAFYALLATGFLWIGLSEHLGGLLLGAPFVYATVHSVRPRLEYDGRSLTVRMNIGGTRVFTPAWPERLTTDGDRICHWGADGRRELVFRRKQPQNVDQPHPGDWRRLITALTSSGPR